MDHADGAVYEREIGETTINDTLDEFRFPFFSFPMFLCMRFVNPHFLRGGVEGRKPKTEIKKKNGFFFFLAFVPLVKLIAPMTCALLY